MTEIKDTRYKILKETSYINKFYINSGYEMVIKVKGSTAVIVSLCHRSIEEQQSGKCPYYVKFEAVDQKFNLKHLTYDDPNYGGPFCSTIAFTDTGACKENCKKSCFASKMRNYLLKGAIPYIVDALE